MDSQQPNSNLPVEPSEGDSSSTPSDALDDRTVWAPRATATDGVPVDASATTRWAGPTGPAPVLPPPDPAAPPARRRRRASGLPTVVGAAVLSAVVASATTVAMVGAILPASAPATATTPSAQTASSVTLSDTDLTTMIARARDSVVTITAQMQSSGRFGFGGSSEGIGSGVIVTTDGYILTNRHVVANATSLTVTLLDGRTFPATVVDILSDHDLALIRVNASGLPTSPIGNSSELKVGQTAIAIGNPLGEYTNSVTRGIISGLGRSIQVADQATRQVVNLSDLIQTDAAINEGNSGGPLLDSRGNVVGINTATSSNGEGLGFATPISAAASLLAKAGIGTA